MSEELKKTNLDEAERFLRWAHPDGPWVLTAIPVEGGRTRTETFHDMRAARGWIEEHSGTWNVYWTVNRTRGHLDKKPKKEDIEDAIMLHVDLDPKKPRDGAEGAELETFNTAERERILKALREFNPAPSAIVYSGGGYQSFWVLDAPFYVGGAPERIADIEAYNRQLQIVLGGDSCFNVDRIMRLPGTINIPDKKKIKKGRGRVTAEVVELTDKVYGLGEFTAAPEVQSTPGGSGVKVSLGEVRRIDLADFPAAVTDRTKTIINYGEDPDDRTRHPSRSEWLFDVICQLVRARCTDAVIGSIILDPDYGISKSVLEKRGREKAYAEEQIAKARAKVGPLRPRIVYSESELPRVLDEAETALLLSGIPIYQMGGRLVRPMSLEAATSDGQGVRRDVGALMIHDVDDHLLLEYLIRAAEFVKVTRNEDGNIKETPYAPVLKFAKHLAARVGSWRLPVLEGISTIPVMRADGSIASANGYDAASRLIIDTRGTAFPPVPDAPDRATALAALDLLIEPIREFPFVMDDEEASPCGSAPGAARSGALAMILTAVARSSLRSAPIFGLTAPTMETGKSLLADVAAMMITGNRATKMSQGSDEVEDEKRLLSVLLRGDPVVVIDNVTREVTGDALCTIITEERWSGRWLGKSQMIEVSTKALFIANGNNLQFRGDMAVRAILVNLDARMERPGERSFNRDLKTWIPDNRAGLVVAALTVLRAFVLAGRPNSTGMKVSRFPDWDLIRGALLWLGQPDPYVTQERIAANDGERSDLVGLMMAIRDAFGDGAAVSATDIITRADGEAMSDGRPGALGIALSAVSPRGVNHVSLGKYLKRFDRRPVDGMWIKAFPDDKRGNRYAVMVEPKQGGLPI